MPGSGLGPHAQGERHETSTKKRLAVELARRRREESGRVRECDGACQVQRPVPEAYDRPRSARSVSCRDLPVPSSVQPSLSD